jgi:predicted RNase H-like HicB family nuclease
LCIYYNGLTFGENLLEAKKMAADVLSGLLASALAHNEPIHFPQKKATRRIGTATT